jgi:hypothetical protein
MEVSSALAKRLAEAEDSNFRLKLKARLRATSAAARPRHSEPFSPDRVAGRTS